ncbi:hypothetical protein [Aliikangiella maris]|uniref:Uncharacterized protein n=2 Tax=Aliikangiella maris TaxID=3162458 RepID=A0ABV2BVA1_9GAMM
MCLNHHQTPNLYIAHKAALSKFADRKLTYGFSMTFLLFTIVIISLLAAGLVRLNSQSVMTNAQQVIATRAFFAAESGAQLQALQIFPVAGGSGACSNQNFSFNTSGLNGCQANTTCNAITINGINYFQIISQGQCNLGTPLQSSRTIEVRLREIN